MLAGIGAFPARAAEPEAVIETTNEPGMTGLIGRILEDPHKSYANVRGPDDCNSEALYLGTKDILRKYVADPVENHDGLRDYLLSGKEQCSCTRAIIGKNIDILLEDLELDISQLPCF